MPQTLEFTAYVASPARFELTAYRLGGDRSILLSYGNTASAFRATVVGCGYNNTRGKACQGALYARKGERSHTECTETQRRGTEKIIIILCALCILIFSV